MSIKKTFVMTALSLAIPSFAMANDLTIINNTNAESTSVINNGACSNILGPAGVTHAHSTNVVTEAFITKGCIFNKNNCKAEVHMTNNCTGPVIANVIFDVKTGIKQIETVANSDGYVVSGSGFTASFDGGPAGKNWFQRLLGL